MQDQKEQSANQQPSLVVRVLVAMFVKNDSGNDAPFVSAIFITDFTSSESNDDFELLNS